MYVVKHRYQIERLPEWVEGLFSFCTQLTLQWRCFLHMRGIDPIAPEKALPYD